MPINKKIIDVDNEFEVMEKKKNKLKENVIDDDDIDFGVVDSADIMEDVEDKEALFQRGEIIRYDDVQKLYIMILEIKENVLIVKGVRSGKRYILWKCAALSKLEVGQKYIISYEGKKRIKKKMMHSFSIWKD